AEKPCHSGDHDFQNNCLTSISITQRWLWIPGSRPAAAPRNDAMENFSRADVPRLHSLSSESVETEIQTAAWRRRRALPRIRTGSEISLRARAQIHALRCAEGEAVRAARLSRLRQERHRAGFVPFQGQP